MMSQRCSEYLQMRYVYMKKRDWWSRNAIHRMATAIMDLTRPTRSWGFLYRQLDVGIAEIREILSDQSFEGISERFSGFIDDTQKEIERLQKKIEKLSYMKQHIDSLAMGIGNCQIKDLPERYILYHQDATELYTGRCRS